MLINMHPNNYYFTYNLPNNRIIFAQSMIYITLLLSISTTARGLIGFDCGGQHLNITSVSLLGAGDCNLRYKTPNVTNVYIQLLQLSEYNYAEVLQCKVEISRTIYYCGMHSHISAVNNGQMEYLLETGYTRCQRMLVDGTLSLGVGSIVDGLKPNRTTSRSVTLAGTIRNDGSCKGTQYSDPYGTWDNVVVQAIARVSLKTSYVPVQVNTGKIILKSGTICALNEGFCLDSDDGYSFWKPMPTSSCNFQQYDVLYEGSATKIKDDTTDPSSPTVYSLSTEDITFALTKTKEQPLCGYTLLRTEHPKLFILETTKGDTFARRGSIPVNNLDIFAYVNSKFVYVEKHVRNQMTSLYHNVIQQKCELEREVLTNTLSFAALQPDEFAYRLMKGPGFMAVVAGEAIHVIKCVPVDVLVRKSEKCYVELPVTSRNASLFLTPKSRILQRFGTERECSHELPTLYHIENKWIQFTPHPQIRQLPPQQLTPMTTLSWEYLTPGPLAVSGIYSEKDIEKLRDHIMFPAEKPALLNTMARGISGHTIHDGTVSMYNLLDEASLQRIADNTASRLWKGFVTFGSATAGVFGIFIIIRVIKLVIDTAIHGYALHTVYGCSLHLLGAIWSSLTHLLLHLARGPTNKDNKRNSTDNEDLRRPSATNIPKAPTEIPSNVSSSVNTNTLPIIYKDLSERLHAIEQIPPTTIGIRS